jgi:DNA-binding NarL/FixJ family response regulator
LSCTCVAESAPSSSRRPLATWAFIRLLGIDLVVSKGDGVSPLTGREHDVLAAATRHLTAAEIAAQLHLSEGTVPNHLSAAIRKLGARNRAEAVVIARDKGWL